MSLLRNLFFFIIFSVLFGSLEPIYRNKISRAIIICKKLQLYITYVYNISL